MLPKVWQVTRHDVVVIVSQWTFWLFSIVAPVILLAYLSFDERGQAGPATPEPAPSPSIPAAVNLPPIGLVDVAGLIQAAPPSIGMDWLVRYPDLESALAALREGTVAQVVHIPADFLASGQVTVYDQEVALRSSGEGMGVGYGSGQSWMLEAVIDYNLAPDPVLLARLRAPLGGPAVGWHATEPAPAQAPDEAFTAQWVGSLVPFVVYFLLVLSGSYLMRSVTAEKENRMAEVLLSSVAPRDLMLGKLVAAAVVLVFQLAIWALGAVLVASAFGLRLSLQSLPLTPAFWALTSVYLLLEYLLCAAIMLAAGAVASNARESGQVIWLLVLPLLPAMMFSSEFIERPDGPVSVFLSLFPLSAPSAVITRLAIGTVPAWQLAVSLAGLAVATGLMLTWAARLFRADTLLSLDPFSWRRLITGWRRGTQEG